MIVDAACRICGTPARQWPRTAHDEFHQACPRCGEFRITGTADPVWNHRRKEPDWNGKLARVSGWIRERNMEGEVPIVSSNTIREVEAMPMPDLDRRLDLLLLYVKLNQQTLGDWVELAPSRGDVVYGTPDHPTLALVAATWSQNRGETDWIVGHAVEQGYLRRVERQATLTPKGLLRAEAAGRKVGAASSREPASFDGVRPAAVLMTALPIETAAVLAHLDGRSTVVHQGTVFHTGKSGAWDVAVAEAGAGNATAAALCERALARFRPRVALFVGVAGGVKDVAIGDVVVATKVYRYESGKVTDLGFLPRPDSGHASHAVDQRARALVQSGAWKAKIVAGAPARCEPQLHVGPILAGEKVIATARGPMPEELRRMYGDALAIEMEGRGFLDGVHLHAGVQAGVVRGISDLLEGKAASDAGGSQELAATRAAAVAFALLDGLDY